MPGETNNAGRTIMDSLCCTPLWFWASNTLDDPYYHELAVRQTETVLKRLVRNDYSSGHTYIFNPETGEPLEMKPRQGNADDSTWSRGQGWGIQGFPTAYSFTGDEKYIAAALKMTEWYADQLGKNIIPPWDFSVLDGERDTSALTLVVNGLLRMAQSKAISEEHRQACILFAEKSMVAVIQKHSALEDPDAWGLLYEGVYDYPTDRGINEFMIWGDYYFVENLLIMAGKNPLELERMKCHEA
jgi:unsaturated chondroitin disaccharide hydrolase